MKDQIEEQLVKLVGLTLTNTTRAADMECLKFGNLQEANKASEKHQTEPFALHLQSPWHITDDTKILVGSGDLDEPIDENAEYDENFDWDKPKGNLRDFKLQYLIDKQNLTVTSFIADNFGGFTLLFSSQVKLAIFPDSSNMNEYSEFWRLIDNSEVVKSHL